MPKKYRLILNIVLPHPIWKLCVFAVLQANAIWMMWSIVKSPCFRQYAVAFTVNLSTFTTGMSLAWPSPVLVKLRDVSKTNLNRPITDEEGSWIVSIGFLCSAFGNIILGSLLDRIGRKYCMILAGIPKILMSILFIFADKVWIFILGRAIIGIADYFFFCVVPVYVSEISDVQRRGTLCTLLQIFSSLGVVITLSVGPFVSYKCFSIVFAVMNLITFVPLFIIPDSPYYLYSKGRTDKAMSVLKFFRGTEDYAEKELNEYISGNNSDTFNKLKLFKNRVFLKTLAMSVFFCIVSQFTGFNAVSVYLQTILESTRTNVKPEMASMIIGLIQLLASCCSSSVSDRFKRKHILISSLTCVMLGLIGLGAFFKIRDTTEISGALNFLPLISLILVVFFYSAGVGSIFWVLVPEFFDDTARALGVATTLVVTALSIFITTKYFTLLILAMGPSATYWFFAAVCFLCCVFIRYCIPETGGKTFKEIQDALGRKQSNNKNLK